MEDLSALRETPLLDEEQWELLLESGGDEPGELLGELIDLFQTEMSDRLARVEADHESGDRDMLAKDAHAIAGSSANMAGLRLSRLARAIEHAAPAEDLGKLEPYVAELSPVYEETLAALRTKIDAL